MARYRILISKKAYKFLGEIDGELGLRIIREVSDLENFPFLSMTHDLAKLKGGENYFRLRVGDVRIIFKIDKPAKTIYVEKIGYRKAIYK
ncbi:MAG: type II toxin-antitoxin system RelE/ParE family toxin [Nitrososphaerales archaeon]|nr:type II toxin-antitoxin system RelE/ParE family toxin [Nitrososphaerales archaeon]